MLLKPSYKPPKIGQRIPTNNINNIATRYLAGGGGGNTGGGNTQTFTTIANAPVEDFNFVRVHFKNIQTTSFGVASLIVAPTNSNTNKIVPSVGNTLTNDGGLTGWQAGTFNNGSATGTVPAKGATARDGGILVSDWIPLQSVLRSDGNKMPFIMARARFDTSVNSNSVGYYSISANSSDPATNYYQEAFFQSGDYTTNPSTLTSAGTSTISPFFAFEFLSAKQVIKIAGLGNSITEGLGATNDRNSHINRVEMLALAAGYPINMINLGSAGAKTDEYYGYGKSCLTSVKPAIALASPYSPNDKSTPVQADFDIMYRRWVDFANFCHSLGILPVAVFLAPNNNYDAATDNLLKAFMNRIKAGNYAVIDLTTVTADTATPRRYKTGLNFDNLHPNNTGYDVMAAALFAELVSLIRKNYLLA